MTHTYVYLDHLEPFLKFLKKVPRKIPSFRVFQNLIGKLDFIKKHDIKNITKPDLIISVTNSKRCSAKLFSTLTSNTRNQQE